MNKKQGLVSHSHGAHAKAGQTRAEKQKVERYKPSIHKLVRVAVGFDIGEIYSEVNCLRVQPSDRIRESYTKLAQSVEDVNGKQLVETTCLISFRFLQDHFVMMKKCYFWCTIFSEGIIDGWFRWNLTRFPQFFVRAAMFLHRL